MTFSELRQFIERDMRMSHIYQPLLIRILLDSGGSSTIRQLALHFLNYDEGEIRHYEKVIKNMPVRVLKSHDVIEVHDDLVKLKCNKLSIQEQAEIRKICEIKIHDFIISRGESTWGDSLFSDPVAGSLRYKVLSEAGNKCALCGATTVERALDIDHIIPRSKGGKSSYENLQVLCSKCNRAKGNRDKTDFRAIAAEENPPYCSFCPESLKASIIDENNLAFTVLDGFPVTQGHTLIIPKRHVCTFSDLTQYEFTAVHDLTKVSQRKLKQKDDKISGFNWGLNDGEAAGQTIKHLHFHLIPRRTGDTPEPRGGVRGVIPGKMSY